MEVWQEIAKDAEKGAERLVAEYGDRIFAAATLLCRDDGEAEDLVFRTFEQAVKKIRQYGPSGDFFSWLYKILLNFHRMELRKNKPDIVLASQHTNETVEISGWMLLGYLRECVRRNRTSRRKEDE